MIKKGKYVIIDVVEKKVIMNKYLKNFYNLYSLDDKVCYQAILEKKDWIFRKLYVPITFISEEKDNKTIYPEIYSLLDRAFYFKKLGYENELFSSVNYEVAFELINEFNSKFRYLNLLDKIDFSFDKDVFFAEIDPFSMDDQIYKNLVANFYPCFDSTRELELKYDSSNQLEILKLAMFQKHGFVLILSNDALLNNCLYLPIIKKIHYYNKMDKEKINSIREICKQLDIEGVVHND